MTDLANEHAERQAHWNENKHNELRSVGYVLYLAGALRVYCDGCAYAVFFRWWHPLSWLVWAAMIVISPFAAMFTKFTIFEVWGFFLSPK